MRYPHLFIPVIFVGSLMKVSYVPLVLGSVHVTVQLYRLVASALAGSFPLALLSYSFVVSLYSLVDSSPSYISNIFLSSVFLNEYIFCSS
jgi:hypothetical protein